MTPPPTSIDGTDITGATIDGQEVQEITVDGQTVFTAEKLPVAYSNLVAWYPFDSSFYGGGNADDVTALLKPAQSGDSTPYNATVNGASFQSSAGVTDVNAGPNSGAFSFDGSNDDLTLPTMSFGAGNSDMTMMAWENFTGSGSAGIFGTNEQANIFITRENTSDVRFFVQDTNKNNFFADIAVSSNQYNHVALSYTTTSFDIFVNGAFVTTISGYNSIDPDTGTNHIGAMDFGNGVQNFFQGNIDDVRLYDKALSASEINTIYNNTDF